MSGWTEASDKDIQSVIDEHNLFVSLDNFNSDTTVDTEFNTLVGLATDVRDETIAADALHITADAAAVGAIWNFGFGMVVFTIAEGTAAGLQVHISSKAHELNKKLMTADADIAAGINPKVSQYVSAFKANNSMVADKRPRGMDAPTCRSILLQFMAHIELAGAKLDVATFKQYAESARTLFNSKEIEAVYNALDKLNLSAKSDDDLKKCKDSIKGFSFGGTVALHIVRTVSFIGMAKSLSNAGKKLAKNKELDDLLEFKQESAFKMMGSWGKFFAAITVIASVADAILDIFDIAAVLEQTKKMVDELNGDIKTNYKEFFNSIRSAAEHYNDAMKNKTD
ncbi:hypothetical protein DL93DRAFT_2088042 [Clavulina sp. PMI_390]|nr:hypothetical protein DL93DRAFT_2088042 [Clavulina sp. PMI_390]